jgi:hypothetical protein
MLLGSQALAPGTPISLCATESGRPFQISIQPTLFLYIHQVISPHFCEVAYLQQPYSGLTEPVGKNDAKLPDVCIRPAISGIFDFATLLRD